VAFYSGKVPACFYEKLCFMRKRHLEKMLAGRMKSMAGYLQKSITVLSESVCCVRFIKIPAMFYKNPRQT